MKMYNAMKNLDIDGNKLDNYEYQSLIYNVKVQQQKPSLTRIIIGINIVCWSSVSLTILFSLSPITEVLSVLFLIIAIGLSPIACIGIFLSILLLFIQIISSFIQGRTRRKKVPVKHKNSGTNFQQSTYVEKHLQQGLVRLGDDGEMVLPNEDDTQPIKSNQRKQDIMV